MEIIKEFCKNHTGCIFVLRAKTYACTLEHFVMLHREAEKDFGHISPQDVKIVMYGGDRYRRMMGIEFTGTQEPPVGYSERELIETI